MFSTFEIYQLIKQLYIQKTSERIKLFYKVRRMSILGSDIIRKHQANSSTSKNAHLFSKTKRFIDLNPECKTAFYTYNSQLSHRNASIGHSKRSDFTQSLTCSPGCTRYSIKSIFDEGKNKGKSFGNSREKSPDNSYLMPQLQKIPGPGQYQNQKAAKMTISYSMRPKRKDLIEECLSYKKNPGPGQYQEIDMEPENGRFTVSKFSDIKFTKIHNKPERFKQIKDSPSPLSYLQADGLSGKGRYILSNRIGRGTRPFDKEARKTFADKLTQNKLGTPGPGFYEKPSEFGVYGGVEQFKKIKATIS